MEPLSEEHIKKFHYLLKINTSDSKRAWFNFGDYKTRPNVVGGIETTLPNDVSKDIGELIEKYYKLKGLTVHDINDFHYQFEIIHPFQDGNGRVGRLVMFKECLSHNIVPFIIEDEYKFFYYRGLSEHLKINEYLVDTCLSAQDNYKRMIDYFLLGQDQ